MLKITGSNLNLSLFMKVARGKEKVKISEANYQRIETARTFVQAVVEKGKPVYGINTGFGKLSDVVIDKSDVNKLQQNLLMSHACGVGDPFHPEIVRGMMLLRVNALIKGYSGIRIDVLVKMLELLNKDVIPVVFSQGSLGASGDLALLAHMCLPLIGLGEVMVKGKRMNAKDGLQKANITPLDHLEAKEGLSLINGTQAMTAVGAIALYDALELEKTASLSLALTMEALEAIIDAFDPRIASLRGHPGHMVVANRIRDILKGSRLITKDGEKRIQDAYSLRCAPQVHGACIDAMEHVKTIVEREMNAVTDNPIMFSDSEEVISAGNFHGEPLALAFDYLAIAISELANISERRIERLVNSALSNGLPSFLVKKPGINSGFMIVQYSAAALVSENKALSHPASVDSIPSSANQEDHVSMGTIAARKAGTILENATRVIAMEIFTACQAIDFRDPEKLGMTTKWAYGKVRRQVPFIKEDSILYPYIHLLEAQVKAHEYVPEMTKEG
ncbi:MAG: histidine ammonia-lyase [Candidatus Izemoplasmatales bacterium]|jgi:histidine ammonia-lyase|nr:histidine ammonia-lyase [Candidatus Izemoplasmatales bacterium]MDD4355477.1 histidine ammonia-lyase [Candidatus Izemoplasmatales bacterium]MDD4988616.1 histidine ammonia-lyase [Candidatus Izemoplasmatales bacterium]MDD5601738.1 histidine ammonia-lyase [Candidatus Izemoplasmatales bacterium]MDY0373280.1 histidine ammonia-lyase [Candidatus Izemoplasmatales bacterium]